MVAYRAEKTTLAIDTTAAQCAVALVSGDQEKVRSERMERGHAERLMQMIEEVTGEDYERLDRIAVCTGPGSFTGIRVGLSAARGLAMGLGVPCIGISRFEVLAFMHGPADGEIIVSIRGRGDVIYLQNFRNGGPENSPYQSTEMPEGQVCGDGVPGADISAALIDPVALARLSALRPDSAYPAPLYLRDAEAAPSRDVPPKLLD